MRKRTIIAVGAAVLLAALAIVASPALARSDHEDDDEIGVWCYLPSFELNELVDIETYPGEKGFTEAVETAEWTGPFTGSSTDYGLAIFEAAGPTLFTATVVFDSAIVGGKTGGLELDVHGGRPDPAADWSGRLYVTGATGELEGLEGHGYWWGPGYTFDRPNDCGVIYYSFDESDGWEPDDHDDRDDDDRDRDHDDDRDRDD